jgi:hypothetical protein
LSNSNPPATAFASYSSPLTNIFNDSIHALSALIVNLFNSIASPPIVILPLPTVMLVDQAAASIVSANFSLDTSIFPPWNRYSCIAIPLVVTVALAPVFFSTTLRSQVSLSCNITAFP